MLLACTGCNFVPDIRHKPQFHNPFPQLHRVAVLPFANQSDEPTLDGSRVSLAYYNELQSIPGFEVLPTGVVENMLIKFQQEELKREIGLMEDFQQFARYLGVDAVLQGAITDYDSYYPPRMTLKVNWYASNPGFHPIPAGYGLPWGTKKEKKIPEWIRLEAERSLATEQMKTQTPDMTSLPLPERSASQRKVSLASSSSDQNPSAELIEGARIPTPTDTASQQPINQETLAQDGAHIDGSADPEQAKFRDWLSTRNANDGTLPSDWPDPQGFIPAKPAREKPPMRPQVEPIMSHMKAYNGHDEDFTRMLSEYFYFRDDTRIGGPNAYLQRSEDFIRFCCHLHITETLAARGGQLESRLILRWPIDRYDR